MSSFTFCYKTSGMAVFVGRMQVIERYHLTDLLPRQLLVKHYLAVLSNCTKRLVSLNQIYLSNVEVTFSIFLATFIRVVIII